MLCFDVAVNGAKVCRAGVGNDGVLTAIVTWVGGPSARAEEPRSFSKTDLHVGGLVGNVHVAWDEHHSLRFGDKVDIIVVESDTPDEPHRRESKSAESPTGQGFQCSFCGNFEAQKQRIVAGPTAYICAKCVAVSVALLREQGIETSGGSPPA